MLRFGEGARHSGDGSRKKPPFFYYGELCRLHVRRGRTAGRLYLGLYSTFSLQKYGQTSYPYKGCSVITFVLGRVNTNEGARYDFRSAESAKKRGASSGEWKSDISGP